MWGKDDNGKVVVGSVEYNIRRPGTITWVDRAGTGARITAYPDKTTKRKLSPAAILNKRLAEQAANRGDRYNSWNSVMPPVYWARFAEAKGYPKLADQFLSWAASIKGEEQLFPTLQAGLGDGEAYHILEPLIFAKSVSWPAYRKRYADFVNRFPDHEYAPEARDCVVQLDRMLAEAKKRPKTKPRTTDEKVAALIYDLRYDTGHKESSTAEAKLAKLGLAAVPQLIKALDDPSLTPGREYSGAGPYRWTPQVSRVADRAVHVLDVIAGRQFDTDPVGFAPWQQRVARPKQRILAWWATAQQTGERESLIEGVLRADHDSWQQAEMLAKKYPNDAPAAVEQGIANYLKAGKGTPWDRSFLVRALQYAKVPGSHELLRKVLASNEDIKVRVQAAETLAKFNFEEGLAAAIRLWREGPMEQESLLVDLPPWLVDTRSAAAIEALRDGLGGRPQMAREYVVNFVGYAFKPPTQGEQRRKVSAKEEVAFRAVSERLLAERLDDHEDAGRPYDDMEGNGAKLMRPRVSDHAAQALGSLDPKRYPFKVYPTYEAMDAQTDRFKAAWKAKRQQ